MSTLLGSIAKRVFGDPYVSYSVGGISYRVKPDGDPEKDKETAVLLHEVNETVVDIISFIRGMIQASEDGTLDPEDRDIDMETLKDMYERLIDGFDPDAIYESKGGEAEREFGREADPTETSYVVNQGEEFHMCVRLDGTKESRVILILVIAHEMTHIASPTPDHDQVFWDRYDLMQRIVSRMGYVNLSDIPSNGAIHCGRIHISRRELVDIATRKPKPRSGSRPRSRPRVRSGPSYLHREADAEGGKSIGSDFTSTPYSYSGMWSEPLSASDSESYRSVRDRGIGVNERAGMEANLEFGELHKNVPLGFSTDRPIVIAPKTIRSGRGTIASQMRLVAHTYDMDMPLVGEEYSRWQ